MKKMAKIVSTLLSILFVVACYSGCRGSGGQGISNQVVDDGKTVNVLIKSSGYGISYVYKMKEEFERIYAKEGYKVNVISPISGMGETRVYQSIYANDGIDVFFTDITLKTALEGEYGQTVADVTDLIMNKKPIKLDGTEENCTVLSKTEGLLYDNIWNGRYYGVPYTYLVAGLGVNKKAFDNVGLTQIPRTSNELFECFDYIMSKYGETGIFPMTHGGGTYLMNYMALWFAQYIDDAENDMFWSFDDAEGNPVEHPEELFGAEFGDGAFEKVLKGCYRVSDYNLAAFGSQTQDFKKAQMQFMQGDAVFYSALDCLYQEECVRNAKYLDDIIMIRIPLISELGTKIFGSGTSYNYSDEVCEQILREIVTGVEANKEVSEIKTEVNAKLSVNMKDEDVAYICKKAGYIFGRHDDGFAVISEKSKVKDIAALLLRMITSDDGAAMFANETKTTNPYNLKGLSNEKNSWISSCVSMISNKHANEFCRTAQGTRLKKFGYMDWTPLTANEPQIKFAFKDRLTLYNDYTFAKEKNDSIFDSTVKSLVEKIYTDAKTKIQSK